MGTPAKNEDLPVFVRWTAFVEWLLPATGKFPIRMRFTLSDRIDNLALDVVEELVEARYSRRKAEILKRINLKLERLRVLLRLCHTLQYLPHQSYEFALRSLEEVGRTVGGWIKQEEKT